MGWLDLSLTTGRFMGLLWGPAVSGPHDRLKGLIGCFGMFWGNIKG